jgi:hypothetical protein
LCRGGGHGGHGVDVCVGVEGECSRVVLG